MIVDYYIVNKGHYGPDILRGRGGRFWYQGGVNIASIAVWLVGAGTSVILTYVAPSPIGATVPTFVISFVLYLGWALLFRRIRTDKPVSHHLTETDPALANPESPDNAHR